MSILFRSTLIGPNIKEIFFNWFSICFKFNYPSQTKACFGFDN